METQPITTFSEFREAIPHLVARRVLGHIAQYRPLLEDGIVLNSFGTKPILFPQNSVSSWKEEYVKRLPEQVANRWRTILV